MPADREQSPVHEPGDDDGTTDEAEEIAGGAEEDELERAHRRDCGGRARCTGPARRGWRRGGRPCTSPGLRGGQGGVKRGVVRVFGKPYGCRMWHVRYAPKRVRAWTRYTARRVGGSGGGQLRSKRTCWSPRGHPAAVPQHAQPRRVTAATPGPRRPAPLFDAVWRLARPGRSLGATLGGEGRSAVSGQRLLRVVDGAVADDTVQLGPGSHVIEVTAPRVAAAP